jgi:hypothetical protein
MDQDIHWNKSEKNSMLQEKESDRLSKKLSKNSKNMLDCKKYLELKMISLKWKPMMVKRKRNEEKSKMILITKMKKMIT